jgi:alkylation response protein AidB-like acyl-CoA dehydrogenase
MGAVAYVVAMEEIGKADQSVAASWNAHLTIGSMPLLYFGTEEQKRKWLVPLARGERLGAFGLTEPEAGSDARGIRTTATADGDGWVINGTKMFTSNAGTDMSLGVIILAVSGTSRDGAREYSAFMVERGTPGFQVGRIIPKIGWHAVDTRELIFENCRVPAGNLLGPRGVGLRSFMQALAVGRISIAALSLGLAQACLEVSLDYARQRRQFGQAISTFQAIQFKLADMATAIENSRLITLKAAWLYDQGREFAREAAMAKLWASDTAMHAALEGVQIHGGYGYTDEYVISRFFRDAKILQIGEGTNEIQRLVIARLLGC